MTSNKKIAVFGGGFLQLSLIHRCKLMGLECIVLDPDPQATGKEIADYFEIVEGDNYQATLDVLRKHKVSAIITSSTDKPLVMMARVAEALNLPFISFTSAVNSTDKFKMKEVFFANAIKCAKGSLVSEIEEIENFPCIIKPLDNSGSRGVYYISNKNDAEKFMAMAKSHTKKPKILCEEFLEGKEYSIESLHFNGQNEVVQITEKFTSDVPYRVELGHIAPAPLSVEIKNAINELIGKMAKAFKFENCAAHTEIIINGSSISVIETSPRLGGDFIISKLVPLSTGINLEDCLINISLNEEFEISPNKNSHAGVFYIHLLEGIIEQIDNLDEVKNISGVVDFQFNLNIGDRVKTITNSLDRYGYVIINQSSREELLLTHTKVMDVVKNRIRINTYA